MSDFNRIQIPGDPEHPITLKSFLEAGNLGKRNTAIVLYDEVFVLMTEPINVLAPFVTSVSSSIPDDELITLRVPAGALRRLNKVFKSLKI